MGIAYGLMCSIKNRGLILSPQPFITDKEAIMNAEFQEKLENEFSFMRRHGGTSRYEKYGCELQAGWYKVVKGLCLDIVTVYEEKGLEVDIVPQLIKERLGYFRFYFDIGQSSMGKIVRELANKWKTISITICEDCGSDGKLKHGLGFVLSLCDNCYQKRINKTPTKHT